VIHSPHFVAWKDISENGALLRFYLADNGFSQIKSASRSALAEVSRSAQNNITNRKYYDAVCKELFFSDEAFTRLTNGFSKNSTTIVMRWRSTSCGTTS
jgi:hypothetical protein